MDHNKAETITKYRFDRRWFAALDLSMFSTAMIVKPRLGFGIYFPAIVASPWVLTAAGHYFDVLPTTTHAVSGFGYSLLTVHALILAGLNYDYEKSNRNTLVAYRRQMLYVPLLIGFVGLNFYQAAKKRF